MQEHRKAFKAISFLALFSGSNFLVTVFIQMVLAATFGAKIEMDAYFVAITVPIVIINLLMSTSEAVFVPFLKDAELIKSKHDLREIEYAIFNFSCLSLFVISIFAFILAPNIIKCLAPGFSVESRNLAVSLFRIITPSIIFGGLSSFLRCLYHTREQFSLPAFSNIINNVIFIIAFFLLYPLIKVKALAYCMVLGNLGQFLSLFPILIKSREYLMRLNLKIPMLNKIGYKFLHILIGGSILSLIVPFERLLASRLPEGSISYLGYASKIISILLFLPSAAIPVVLLPNLSRHFTGKNLDKLRHNLSLGMRFTFFIICPICVLLFIFRAQLVYILLERSNFDSIATQRVSQALVCYIGVLFGVSLASVTAKGFFAMHNTLIPAIIMSVSFIFYVLIAAPLSKIFSFPGLALSLSITVLLGLFVDLLILGRMLKGLEGKFLFTTAYKVISSSLIMAVIVSFIYREISFFSIAESKPHIFLKLGISSLAGLGAYLILCLMLRLEEINLVSKALFAKLPVKQI